MDDFMFLPQTGHRNIIICLWFTQTNPKYNPSTSHILQALCFHACTCSVGAALKRTRCSVWPDRRKYEKKKNNNASSVHVCKYELGRHILMHPYVHGGWMYRVCWNTLFSSKPKAPQLERGWVRWESPTAGLTYISALRLWKSVTTSYRSMRRLYQGRCFCVCSASSTDCLFLLLSQCRESVAAWTVSSQDSRQTCRLSGRISTDRSGCLRVNTEQKRFRKTTIHRLLLDLFSSTRTNVKLWSTTSGPIRVQIQLMV